MDTKPRHVALTLAQIRALLDHAREGQPPAEMDGRHLGALKRAADRLDAELTRKPLPPFFTTLADLEAALGDVRRAPFVSLIHRRLRDLLAVVRLWCAAEDLPSIEDRDRLCRVDDIDSLSWAADVLDAADAAGVKVEGVGK